MTTNEPKHAWLREEISTCLDELSRFFKPYYHLTFIARNPKPEDGDADVVISDDSMALVVDALKRRIEVDGDFDGDEPPRAEQENQRDE